MLSTCDCQNNNATDCALLVGRWLRQDKEAIEALWNKHQARVFGIVRAILGGQDNARCEDVTQEIFIRLFLKIGQWKAEAPFCYWLAVVAKRAAYSELRKRRLLQCEPTVHEKGVETSPAVELQDCMEKTIARFSPQWRKLLELREQGFTQEEVAQKLGISRRTVNNWLVEIRSQLLPCVE